MNIYNVPCAVTAELNRYLTQMDRENLWQEAVESRQEALLADGGDYYPFSTDNLSEAIGEINIKTIAVSLKAGKHEEAGKVLASLVISYWEREAQCKAEREIKNEMANTCLFCRGLGCRHCGET